MESPKFTEIAEQLYNQFYKFYFLEHFLVPMALVTPFTADT